LQGVTSKSVEKSESGLVGTLSAERYWTGKESVGVRMEGEETEETDLVHAACEEGDNEKGVRMVD